ncbi:MAG: DUF4394 domain-containing protein [Acidobacteriota bacterium]
MPGTIRNHRTLPVFTTFALLLAACLGFALAARPELGARGTVSANPLQAVTDKEGTIFAVTSANNLISFSSVTPSVILSNRAISGLQPGEAIVGLDFRPRTGQLFALSGTGRLYRINTSNAVATLVNAAPAPINGNFFGFDFNPAVDRIRLVSDTGQNLRLNPENGAVAGTDSNVSYASGDPNQGLTPQIVGAAYTNNFGGSTSTTLFVIDSRIDTLARQGSVGGTPDSPNLGQLTSIGPLGIDSNEIAGFDISSPGNTAFASLTRSGASTSSLYSINLVTGGATALCAIGVNEVIRDIAVVTRVEQIFALTASNNLLGFNSGDPTTITSIRSITGLSGGDSLVGLDFRPATGELFALSRSGVLYIINTSTGAATRVSAAGVGLSGNSFGVDFNPVVDRVRVVSDARQNVRINPLNGTLAGTDAQLVFATGDTNASATPNVVGAAYTANSAGTLSTTLYGIDSNLDVLVIQGSIGGTPVSPNTGQLTTVGGLGVNTSDRVGFDIAPQTGAAFASLTAPGAAASQLYTVNTTTGSTTLIGSIGGGEVILDIAIPVRVEKVFAVNANNNLITFNSLTPGTPMSQVLITGLQPGETIAGIDFRPASGQLFALGSSSRLYRLNTTTGVATAVSNAVLNPLLNGTSFGFDFNPVVDRVRVVSDSRQNLRLHPDLGTVAGVDTNLTYAAGDVNAGALASVTGAAYSDNFAGTPSTSLFVIDSNLDIVARQGSAGGSPTSPNNGQLFTIGALGTNVDGEAGFDISDATGSAYASLNASGASSTQFYTVNLATGAATLVGSIGGGARIRGIAIATGFNPSTQTGGLTVVNAASFAPGSIAPDSIAAAFGNFQTQNGQAFSGGSVPLPTTLGGVKLTIGGVDAGLFFVSNGQINFAVPSSLPNGLALVTVTNSDGSTTTGSVNIDRVGPGLFTANSSGSGTAAAFSTFDGVTLTPVTNSNGSERPLDPGTVARPDHLVLFGTGIRNAPGANPGDSNGVAEAVTVTIQGIPAVVLWAGPAPGNTGLDQINVVIPPSLAGAGRVQVKVTVAGQTSNVVTVTIGGTPAQVTTQTITVGQTANGSLSANDQILAAGDGSDSVFFFDAFRFNGVANSGIAIDLRSDSFDAAILLYRRNAAGGLDLIAAEDQLGGLGDGDLENNNALLLTVLPQTGEYVVFVTSADSDPSATGDYTLRIVSNVVQPISYGSSINASISTGDLQTSAGDFLDAYSFAGVAGDRVQIRMSSPTFDPLLILSFNSGDVLTADDNNGGGPTGLDSLISVTLPETGIYIIVATPFEPNRTGSYSFSLIRNTNATALETEALAAESIPQSVRMRQFLSRKVTRESGSRFERFAARRVVSRELEGR